ncbi:MAG: DUF5666 domain-containing protein [Candidatus Dormiibacterota bacterium]
MFRPTILKAIIATGAIFVAAAVTAAAAAPAAGQALTAARTAAAKPARQGNHAAGTILSASGTEMTIKHGGRARKGQANPAPADSQVTFELNNDTKVYKFGDKDKKDLGTGALKPGMPVGVRYEDSGGKKLAKTIVILPDVRAGQIVSKDADSHGFTIKTREGSTVHVITNDNTRFVEGRGKNRKAGSFADLKVGNRVVVLGEEDNQHNFDAAVVRSANKDAAVKPAQ